MTDEMLNSADEFDVSDAGLPTLEGAVAQIAEFEVEEKENGTQHVITFNVEGVDYPVTVGYWFTHSNNKAAQAGKGTLKRIARAAIGQTTYSRTSLIGAKLLVNLREDDSGFPRLSRFLPIEA